MTRPSEIPAEAQRWLRDVDRRVAPLPPQERHEVVAGLTEHFRESTANGGSTNDVLARMGSSADVAERALEDYQQQTGIDVRPGFFTAKRVIQAVALALAVAAALAILLLPSYVVVETDSAGNEMIHAKTATEVVGPLIYLIAVVPIVFTTIPILARGRLWQPLSIVSTVLMLVFAAVGSLTVGWYLIPAALALAVSTFFPTSARNGSGFGL